MIVLFCSTKESSISVFKNSAFWKVDNHSSDQYIFEGDMEITKREQLVEAIKLMNENKAEATIKLDDIVKTMAAVAEDNDPKYGEETYADLERRKKEKEDEITALDKALENTERMLAEW